MRQFSHGGSAFILGRHDDGTWAIWHLGHHWAAPAQVFPPTEQGWSTATTTLQAWDPTAQRLDSEQIRQLVASQPTAAAAQYAPAPAAHQPYYPPAVYRAPPSNGVATAGGVIGIVGAVLSLIPLLGIFIGIPLGILAIVLASIGLGKAGTLGVGRGIAITGLVLGILTVIFKLIPGVNLL